MGDQMERYYRTASIVVWVLVALVCIGYSLILVNPQGKLVLFAAATPPGTGAVSQRPGQPSTAGLTRPPGRTGTATHSATLTRTAPSPRPPVAFFYRPVLQSCAHAQGIVIKGTVWIGTDPQEGVRVRVSTQPNRAAVVAEDATQVRPDGSLTYQIVLKRSGSFGPEPATWFVWTADANGDPSSDPGFSVRTNNLPPDNPSACWSPLVDFAH